MITVNSRFGGHSCSIPYTYNSHIANVDGVKYQCHSPSYICRPPNDPIFCISHFSLSMQNTWEIKTETDYKSPFTDALL